LKAFFELDKKHTLPQSPSPPPSISPSPSLSPPSHLHHLRFSFTPRGFCFTPIDLDLDLPQSPPRRFCFTPSPPYSSEADVVLPPIPLF